MADDNDPGKSACTDIRLIQIDDRHCPEMGFRRFNPVIAKSFECSAYDKVLYSFSSMNTDHGNVWPIEEDVSVTSPDMIPVLDRKYGEADIIGASNTANETRELDSWFWWRHAPVAALSLPWA